MAGPARPPTERFIELNGRLGFAYVAGYEERSRSEQGRGLTDAELRLVAAKYQGDLPGR